MASRPSSRRASASSSSPSTRASAATRRHLVLDQQRKQLVARAPRRTSTSCGSGRAFYTNTTTAVAAVVAVPTTAVMFALYNNEPDGGRSYVIDWVSAQNVVSTAVASQAQLLVNLGQVREAAPTDGARHQEGQRLGGGSNDTRARTILTATALPATTGLATNWFPVGGNGVKPGVAATPGYGCGRTVDGRFIVPPGRYFAVHVVANVVGETFHLHRLARAPDHLG
jgi:hypothetical protein